MQPETARYLQDMLGAAQAIRTYLQGVTEEHFLGDRAIRDAIYWNFCVIGEALAQLHNLDPVCAAEISEHERIIGFRNQLIHGYGVIDNSITWQICITKLPILISELEQMLKP